MADRGTKTTESQRAEDRGTTRETVEKEENKRERLQREAAKEQQKRAGESEGD